MIPYPPNLTDLTLADFFIFPGVKYELAGLILTQDSFKLLPSSGGWSSVNSASGLVATVSKIAWLCLLNYFQVISPCAFDSNHTCTQIPSPQGLRLWQDTVSPFHILPTNDFSFWNSPGESLSSGPCFAKSSRVETGWSSMFRQICKEVKKVPDSSNKLLFVHYFLSFV